MRLNQGCDITRFIFSPEPLHSLEEPQQLLHCVLGDNNPTWNVIFLHLGLQYCDLLCNYVIFYVPSMQFKYGTFITRVMAVILGLICYYRVCQCSLKCYKICTGLIKLTPCKIDLRSLLVQQLKLVLFCPNKSTKYYKILL